MATDLSQKIIKQLEYYFGDINLPRDRFLQERLQADEGWVPIEVLLTFKRLATMTTEPGVVAEAIRSAEGGLVQLSEDSTKVRRDPDKPAPELNDERKKELMDRSAYAKGFPADEELEAIIKFMESHGNIESCYKRSYFNKATKQHVFKGSCFIIFKTLDDCKKFIEVESLKYKDTELIRKFKEKYLADKKEEVQLKRDAKKQSKKAAKNVVESKLDIPKGATLSFSGVETGQVLTREEIKEKIREIGDVEPAFINYEKSNPAGFIRLQNANSAAEFFEKLTDGSLEVGDVKLKLKVLEGEEEAGYLKATIEEIAKIRQAQKKSKWAKRRGHHQKRQGGEDNGPATKRVKTE